MTAAVLPLLAEAHQKEAHREQPTCDGRTVALSHTRTVTLRDPDTVRGTLTDGYHTAGEQGSVVDGIRTKTASAPTAGQPCEHLNTVVLVVDDDPEIRDLVRWLLEDEGWTVETAADGRAALDQATRARPALIVLDMGLPLLSGEEVALRLNDVYANPPPIVVVSADGRAGERAARIGAASFLHKPFNVDDLANMVRHTLGQV